MVPTVNPVMINKKWPLQVLDNKLAMDWISWEFERFEVLRDLIEAGTVVYDIGSEEGDFPALYGTWGAEVVLIEPSQFAWPQIKAHWEANVDHPPAGMFVGFATDEDVTVETEYDDQIKDGWPACCYQPMRLGWGFSHISDEFDGKLTRHNRLDTLKTRYSWPTPDLLTIDVEGSEGYVLRGATGILENDRPEVVVALHSLFMWEQYREGTHQVWDLMRNLDYTGTLIWVDHEEHVWFQP